VAGTLKIGEREIGDNTRCYVIAEIGHNHQGSLEKARELFREAKLAGANAVKLQAGSDARSIEHVEIRPLGGPTHQIRAGRYVLACGTIENARLMLASNDVEPAGIGNRHDQVGRFFMEHPAGRIGKVETRQPFELWAACQKRFMKAGPPLAPALCASHPRPTEC
jgi:hypothetical protein